MSTAELLRRAARRYASGVAIVAVRDGRDVFAKTVSSFQSLSLDPPLVSVSIFERSPFIAAVKAAGCFAVTVLRREQQAVSRFCAMPGNGRRVGAAIPTMGAVTGAPVVFGYLSYFDCSLESILEGGDHRIVVGRVVAADSARGDPLLYYDGDYRHITDDGVRS